MVEGDDDKIRWSENYHNFIVYFLYFPVRPLRFFRLALHRTETIMDGIGDIRNKDFDAINKFIIKLNKYQNLQTRKILYSIYLAYLKTGTMKIVI